MKKRGELVVVGLGIGLVGQVTIDARQCIEAADEVHYIATSRPSELWLRSLNPNAYSLSDTYAAGRSRVDSYREMAERICSRVRAGVRVCACFYGHPGVFVQASHAAIRSLKRTGHAARMLPGISADACLFADLGVNPGDRGLQSFEATDLLLHRRRLDPTTPMLLWQAGVLGEPDARGYAPARRERVQVLTNYLLRSYPPNHTIVIYVASTSPITKPYIRRLQLSTLPSRRLLAPMTLFVPALKQRRPDARIAKWFTEAAETAGR